MNSDRNDYPVGPRAFRTDINGLRSWAVVAVIFYHFNVPGFSGGFIGVDVFFVISGYLMMRIVVQGVEQNNFSVTDFYLARVRRIVPALLAMCIILLAFGWLALSSPDYKQLATHVIASLLFFSNITYWREAGYFDNASHDKWLLHTWSLSVEWQYYLLFPMILLSLWRYWPQSKRLAVMCIAALLVSLVLSATMTHLKPTPTFYLLPTRVWELLAGGVVFLVARNHGLSRVNSLGAEIVGLTLIIASTTLFSSQTPWPGTSAILPVAGSALVLTAARPNSIWTCSRVAQLLGNWSYSLYLWHWPVFVALGYLNKYEDVFAVTVGLILTFFLGWISYRFIEIPYRRYGIKQRPKKSILVFCTSVFAVVAFAAWIEWLDGASWRLPENVVTAAQWALDKNPRKDECLGTALPVPECTYGGKDIGVIVVGDSHAATVMRAIEAALPKKNLHVLDWSLSACPTAKGAQRRDGSICSDFVDWMTSRLHTIPKTVPLIIVNRWSYYSYGPNEKRDAPAAFFGDAPVREATHEHLIRYRKAIIETACEFAKNRPVYLMRPIPEMKIDVPNAIARVLLLHAQAPDISVSLEEYENRHAIVLEAQNVASARCGVKVLDPLPYLCWDGRCHGMKNGRSLYFDDDHLSEYGAHFLIPMFRSAFLNLM